MAKTKTKPQTANGTPALQSDGETVSGYFRKIFKENPRLLKERSNDDVLRRWLADHPDHKEVPQTVKNNLANIKSVLRKKSRKKGGRPKAEQPVAAVGEVATKKVAPKGLEALEEQIDECLTFAKRLDREGLQDVIVLLRRARNAVVWKAGQ
jgi:hypothetical protein